MPKYFPVAQIVTRVIEVPVGDGDRDISYLDSFDVSEQLAGTLGPVQTQDSIDVDDEFVAKELTLQESFDNSDNFGDITGLALNDSIDISERLSGTIGPISAPDTFDTTDDPVFGPLVLQDSFDTSVVASSDLTATALDSFDIAANLGQITRFDYEKFFAADALGEIQQLQVDDSVIALDQFGDISGLALGETFDVGTTANSDLTARNPDSFAVGDLGVFGPLTTYDSLDIFDARGIATLTNARLWPNTVVSQTGMTTPNNLVDLNETTGATISVTQSGGLIGGSSQTANGNIRVSCANVNFSPDLVYTTAQIQWGWTTTASGGLQTGNSVSAVLEYSVNNGTSWLPLETVTTVASTGNPTLNVTVNTTQVNALEFRATITVVSGTTLVVGGANQTFSMRYFRIQFSGTQTL